MRCRKEDKVKDKEEEDDKDREWSRTEGKAEQ